MALWKSEHSPGYQFTLHSPGHHLDLPVLIATSAAAGLLLVWLVPLPLVPPLLGIVSFTVAVIVALFAYYSGADRGAKLLPRLLGRSSSLTYRCRSTMFSLSRVPRGSIQSFSFSASDCRLR
jgi:hypothetical protein